MPVNNTNRANTKRRLAILVSGRGSNMAAIAEACQSGELNATVSIVISNNPDVPALAAAQSFGIETAVVNHRQYTQREDFDQALHETLLPHDPDWIALAGFMRILGTDFVRKWQGRIINIHPSLLPRYPGLNTHSRAIANGDKEAGATVHIVTETLDDGPIVAQEGVPINDHDTAETLSNRVLAIEHTLYIKALKQCITVDRPVARLQ
ncbi:MAG: phosphoribosylglycinamide formyltransferase [Granulosicoccus sp.]|nr:phosphoribosylglycinamide formyltransferase [Granulosicoccus sp.]